MLDKYHLFKNQHVWARQFNPEPEGTRLVVDGGTFWALGYKTERNRSNRGGQKRRQGRDLRRSVANFGQPAVADVRQRQLANVGCVHLNFSQDPFAKFVVEQKGAESKAWGDANKEFRGWRGVFYEGRLSP